MSEEASKSVEQEPDLELIELAISHPLASLYSHVVALLDAPSAHVRAQALKVSLYFLSRFSINNRADTDLAWIA